MVLSSTLTDIGFVDAAVVALLGYAVVFVGLIALMIVIRIEGKISTAKKTAAAQTTANIASRTFVSFFIAYLLYASSPTKRSAYCSHAASLT